MVADVPASETASAYITPISTVVALAETTAAKEAVLVAFGITGITPEELLTKDIWADSQSADPAVATASKAIAKANVQVAAILQTAVKYVDTSSTVSAEVSALRAISMVKQMSTALANKAVEVTSVAGFVAGALLTATTDIAEVITAAVTAYEIEAVSNTSLSDQVVVVAEGQTVAEAVATKLTAFADTIQQLAAVAVEAVTDIAAISDITSLVATETLKLREQKMEQADSLVATTEEAFEAEYTTYKTALTAAAGDATAIATALSNLTTGIQTTVAAAVSSAITTLEETLATLDIAAATAAAALETELTTTGYALPSNITILETVE